MSIKILLADDHKITREGLCSLINEHDEMEVIAQADNGRMALELVREKLPDVVIMDVTMPDLNGIEATRKILNEFKDIKIIGLSMHSDTLFISEMLKNGASGYLLKECAFEELAKAINTVVAGKIYLSPAISGILVDDYLHHLSKKSDRKADVLTIREREVLQLIAEGNSTKQTAIKLHVSTKTIETHRRQIMQKLDTHSVAELTKYAIKTGLTGL